TWGTKWKFFPVSTRPNRSWQIQAAHCTWRWKSKIKLSLRNHDHGNTKNEHKRTRRQSRDGRVEGNLGRHRPTYQTTQCRRYRRAFPDPTRTARGARNEESAPLDQWRSRSEHSG